MNELKLIANVKKITSVIGKTSLYVFLLLFSINGFSQSPWVNKKGSIYGQVASSYLSYSNIVDESGAFVEASFRTTDVTTGLFAEYSLTDKTAIIVDFSHKFVQVEEQSLSSLGDSRIKIKHQLPINIPLAIHYGYTAPLSERQGFLRTGYNQHALDIGVSGGFGGKRYYTYGSVSYNYRTNIPNQLIIDAEYGYRTTLAKKPLYLMFHFYGTINISKIEDVEASDANLYHNNAEFLSPGLKFSYNPINNFWINIGIHSAVRARNTGGASSLSVGLAYSLKK